MKGYIFTILLALTTLTSCVIDDGDNRQPIDVGIYVAKVALSSYKNDVSSDVAHALIADWYLSAGDELIREKYLDEYNVEYSEGVVNIIKTLSYSGPRTVVSFTTDGKLLSEGGTWVMNGYTGCVITIASVGDGKYRYTALAEGRVIDYDVDVELISRDIDNGLRFGMDGGIYFEVSDYNNSETRNVLFTSDIKEQLVFHVTDKYNSRYLSGRVSVICENPCYDTVDRVEMTFVGTNICEVTYLDYRGEFKVSDYWLYY